MALPPGVIPDAPSSGLPSGVLPDVQSLVAPSGDVVGMPSARVHDALNQGYRVAAEEDIAKAERHEKYGTFGQQVATGAEAAGSALTFGLSPKLETMAGITTPEDIRGRAEENPVWHTGGTGLGVVAGALVPGLDEVAAPGLIAKAGKGAAAITNGVGLPGMLGKVAPALVAGATEGALYSGSDVTEKALLGDPQLSWEKVASQVGLGALFGGALSGGGKTLSELLPENLGESMADKLGETAGERNLKAAAGPGGSKAIIKRLQKQMGRANLTDIGQEMGEAGLVGPLSTPEKTYQLATAYQDSAWKDMSGLLQEAGDSEAASTSSAKVFGRARNEILKPLESDIGAGPAETQFRSWLERAEQITGAENPSSALSLEELHGLRKDVSRQIYGLAGDQTVSNGFKDALRDFRSMLSDEIESGFERSGLGSDAWKAANRRYQVGAVAQQLAEDGMLKHTGNNLVSLTEIMAGLAGAGAHGLGAGTLAALGTHFAREHASGILGWAATGAQRRLLSLIARSDKSLAGAIAAIFSGGAGEASAKMAATGTEHFAHGGMVGPENFADVSSHLRDLGGNPDRLADAVSKQVSTLQAHAPGTADAARGFAARVVQHLGSKLPEEGPHQLLDAPFEPSGSELAEYHRHHEVAERGPLAVLEHAARGTLHPDHLEASATLYPKLHAEAQQLVAERLSEHLRKKEHVPIAMRGTLGMLLGADLEHAQSPQAVLYAQQALQAPAQPDQGGSAKASKPRQVQTKFSNRAATGSQQNSMSLSKDTT